MPLIEVTVKEIYLFGIPIAFLPDGQGYVLEYMSMLREERRITREIMNIRVEGYRYMERVAEEGWMNL